MRYAVLVPAITLMAGITLLVNIAFGQGEPVIKAIRYSKKTTLLFPASYTLRFSLWDSDEGGNEVWSEEKQVNLSSAKITTYLGEVTPLDQVDFSIQLWVQVERKTSKGSYKLVGQRDILPVAPYSLWSYRSESAVSAPAYITDGAITSAKIADGAVTDQKISGPISGYKISSAGLNADTLDGFHASNFAPVDHNHDGVYALLTHNHDSSYAPISHNHDGTYASVDHNHDGVYAPLAHNHDSSYAPVSHEHDARYYTRAEADATFAVATHNHDSIYQKKYAKLAVVAQSGGDYQDPLSAMNDIAAWCGTPGPSNPCLLKIMPGIYTYNGNHTIQMQSYVDIEGSGENVTVISGKNFCTLADALNAEIRNLTVQNTKNEPAICLSTGGSTDSFMKITNVTVKSHNAPAIVSSSSSPLLKNVTVVSANNYGILNQGNGSPRIENSSVKGATYAIMNEGTAAIYVAGSKLDAETPLSGNGRCVASYDASYSSLKADCSR